MVLKLEPLGLAAKTATFQRDGPEDAKEHGDGLTGGGRLFASPPKNKEIGAKKTKAQYG